MNSLLEDGDILFNRTNSKELVGKCEVFREVGDWVFASYLIRVRTNEARLYDNPFSPCLPGISIGRLQIDRFSRQIIGMTICNAEGKSGASDPGPSGWSAERLVAPWTWHGPA